MGKAKIQRFSVMNHTFTPMAARLLKVNIISPITTEKSINDRLDAVEGQISYACLRVFNFVDII